ncbi:MAG TPA: maleylpyruvate isomerase family mycothiol-dependent enzyme [Mycobacterium sp.]|nr:maleylpyruvate isomerase family mycothiol-dependent enzyme [Mycobacterium sp.]
MDAETSWRAIEQERLSLADLLEDLTDDEWNSPSLCKGWRIKDVAAHVALAPQPPSPLAMLVEGVRAGGRFHKLNHDVSVRHADRPDADLVAELRAHAASRRLPAVTSYRNILYDILVHGQDIAIPLGRRREMPKDAARAGIERVWTMGWPFWAKRRLNGFRFTATDVDWAAGDGPEVTGAVDALLLLFTGRRVALTKLSGPGLDDLSKRVG